MSHQKLQFSQISKNYVYLTGQAKGVKYLAYPFLDTIQAEKLTDTLLPSLPNTHSNMLAL